ncbi:TPA: nicotinate-nucleotide diphosphorylase (carboxylating), partial [Candidatus Woesearchaeota archaeon]|nr:nicotinate-nucleotide diphosphorylase (carboxylating) [Candidatus Woesearchaeota archaeon]
SGGINPQNISSYADTGVDVISMGYLTHSPTILDLTQLIE